MTIAVVFPGQGSQSVGMGKALAETFADAREVFGEIDEALKDNLSKLIFEGPDETLRLTENAQPALMAVSLAVMRVLEKQGGWKLKDKAAFVAGHSLGEYSALAAAGALTLADTARILRQRGQAMQQAVPVGIGAMAALLGIDLPAAQDIAEAATMGRDICAAANDNAPGQVVVSGHAVAVDRALALAAERGFKRSVRLPVSAPFHCPLMAPAADIMAKALGAIEIKAPAVPLVANVTASTVTDPEEIRTLLVQQVTGLVRWRESVLYLKEHGVDKIIEAGSGNVLAGLVRRIDKELPALSLQTPQDIEAFLKG